MKKTFFKITLFILLSCIGFRTDTINQSPKSTSKIENIGCTNNNFSLNSKRKVVIESISVNSSTTLALDSEGFVWAWGDNWHGQLGLGSDNNYINVPMKTKLLSNIISVKTSGDYSLALGEDGKVWQWGYVSATSNMKIPIHLEELVNIIAISTTEYTSIALSMTGELWMWRHGNVEHDDVYQQVSIIPQKIETAKGIEEIQSGYESYYLKDENNFFWILGRSLDNLQYYSVPVRLNIYKDIKEIKGSATGPMVLLNDGNVMEADIRYNRVVLIDGTSLSVEVWDEQFGDDSYYFKKIGDKFVFNKIESIPYAKTISKGNDRSLIIDDNGKVWVWGLNSYGELLDTISVLPPTILNDMPYAVEAAIGYEHITIIDDNGNVWTYGKNTYGQLGIGEIDINEKLKPFLVEFN